MDNLSHLMSFLSSIKHIGHSDEVVFMNDRHMILRFPNFIIFGTNGKIFCLFSEENQQQQTKKI